MTDDFAVDSPGLLRKPFDEAAASAISPVGFGQGLALFGRHGSREGLSGFPASGHTSGHDDGALLRGFLRPGRHRGGGRRDRAARGTRSSMRHLPVSPVARDLSVDGRAGNR